MSMSEPFLPVEEPTSKSPAEELEEIELDDDQEPDILPGASDANESEPEPEPEFPANTTFHPPVPGDRVTEERLRADLGEQ